MIPVTPETTGIIGNRVSRELDFFVCSSGYSRIRPESSGNMVFKAAPLGAANDVPETILPEMLTFSPRARYGVPRAENGDIIGQTGYSYDIDPTTYPDASAMALLNQDSRQSQGMLPPALKIFRPRAASRIRDTVCSSRLPEKKASISEHSVRSLGFSPTERTVVVPGFRVFNTPIIHAMR